VSSFDGGEGVGGMGSFVVVVVVVDDDDDDDAIVFG